MDQENPFDIARPEKDMYFTTFNVDTEYKIRIYNVKNADIKTFSKPRSGESTDYYVFNAAPLEDYPEAMLYKYRRYRQNIPKKSFVSALWDYRDRHREIHTLFDAEMAEIDIDLTFVKRQRSIVIKELIILE